MRTTYPHILRFALPLAASLLLLLLLVACGGGGEDGYDTPQSSAEGTSGSGSSTDTGQSSGDKDPEEPTKVETRASNFYEDIELSPDDLLKFLHSPSENLLYLDDVSQAIEALRDHGDIRDQLKELWDDKDLTDEFGIKIQDVDYVVFGESGSPDVDVFLLGGLDLGDLRDSLEAADFLKDEISGLEVWLEDEDYHGGIAFIGDAILISYDLPDALRLFDGSYETTVDLMGRIASGEARGEDVLQQLAGNEGVTGTILTHLALEFHDRYIGGTDGGGSSSSGWRQTSSLDTPETRRRPTPSMTGENRGPLFTATSLDGSLETRTPWKSSPGGSPVMKMQSGNSCVSSPTTKFGDTARIGV